RLCRSAFSANGGGGWLMHGGPSMTDVGYSAGPRFTAASCARARLAQPKVLRDGFQLVGSNQYIARLRAFGRAHDAAGLQDVHQPACLGEPDAELALQHRGGTELQGDYQLRRLQHQVKIIPNVLGDPARRLG